MENENKNKNDKDPVGTIVVIIILISILAILFALGFLLDVRRGLRLANYFNKQSQ